MAAAFMGKPLCRLCGEDNGAVEYSDGVYHWPEGLAHYVSEHSVRLPGDVVKDAVDRLDSLEASSPSLECWLAQTRGH